MSPTQTVASYHSPPLVFPSSPSPSLHDIGPESRPSSPFLDYEDAPPLLDISDDDLPPLWFDEDSNEDSEDDEDRRAGQRQRSQRLRSTVSQQREEEGPPSQQPPRIGSPRPGDPGQPFEPPLDVFETVGQASDVWFWRPVMLLVAWLHVSSRLSHRAAGLVLSVFRLIFIALQVIPADADTPQTLRTTFARLSLGDKFFICPLCPNCYRVYDPDSPEDARCTVCEIPLYKTRGVPPITPVSPRIDWGTSRTTKRPLKPALQSPMRLPSDLIAELISSTPDMEEELDKWRKDPPFDGKNYRRIQDGAIWRTIRGKDGERFFDNRPGRANAAELRIGVTMGFDG